VQKVGVSTMRAWMVIAMVGALLSTGCAFMFKGTKQDVRFESVPREADVRVDNQYMGATPTTVPVNRNQAANVLVSKDGFKEQYVQIHKHPDAPWWFWDIATCVVPVTLCIPVLFDAISGAWMSVDDDVRVKLEPLPILTRPTQSPASAPPIASPPANDSPAPAEPTPAAPPAAL
jgi:hypothetical protein